MRQSFRLNIEPPTATHQQKKVRVVRGHPQFYEPANVKEARKLYMEALKPYTPITPYTGAVKLITTFYFKTKTHKGNTWKTTKPDTDNIIKMLKDCMTASNYWIDDAQVVVDVIRKKWTRGDGFIDVEIEEL